MNGNKCLGLLGGVCTGINPLAIAWGSSSSFRLDVFVRGSDGAVVAALFGLLPAWFHLALSRRETGRQHWARSLFAVNPAKLTVFAEGTDGALWYKRGSGHFVVWLALSWREADVVTRCC